MQEIIKNAVVTRVLTTEKGGGAGQANTQFVCFNRTNVPGEFSLPISRALAQELNPGTRVTLTTTIEIEDEEREGKEGGKR